MRLHTVYPGTPVAQARARHTRAGVAYTPKATRDAQTSLGYWLRQAATEQDWRAEQAVAVAVHVTALFVPPQSWSTRRRVMAGGRPHTVRPDADNLGKLVLDAASGVLWRDDRQVAECMVRKLYGDEAATVIQVYTLDPLPWLAAKEAA